MHYWSKIIDSIQEGDNNMVKDKVIQIPDLNYRHVIDFRWAESTNETPKNVIFEHSWDNGWTQAWFPDYWKISKFEK